MKTYLVFSFDKDSNKWNIENSFESRSEALDEKDCLRAHLKAKEIKIIPLHNATNNGIMDVLKTLNGAV